MCMSDLPDPAKNPAAMAGLRDTPAWQLIINVSIESFLERT